MTSRRPVALSEPDFCPSSVAEADDGAAGLNGYRAERGQCGKHGIEDGPQTGAVAVLVGDEVVRFGGQEAG